MKRRWVRSIQTLCVMLVAGPQLAYAGVCTGKPDGTTCDAGQDLPYAMICVSDTCVACTSDASAVPQFVDNGNGTITDRQTCLVWEKKDNAGGIHDLNNVYQWSSTGSATDGDVFTGFLAGLNGSNFAGHHDWRLPTAAGKSPPTGQPAEAESIEVSATCGPTDGGCVPPAFNANCGPYSATDPPSVTTSNPGCTVDGAGGTQECSCAPFYHAWSASTVAGSPSEAWLECYTVTANGLSSPDKTSEYNARAVRGGAAPLVTCSATPLANCLAPGKAALTLTRSATNPSADKVMWSWTHGDAVAVTDLGDPTATTTYAVCIYANGSLLLQATASPGSLWRLLGGIRRRGYEYADRTGSSDGLTKIEVSDGAATKTKASVAGKGAHLPALTLPLAAGQLPVTVQLVTDEPTPECWSAAFTNAPAENDAKKFKAKLP
jgi:hypothetical protein